MDTIRQRIRYFIDNQGIEIKDFLIETSLKKGVIDSYHKDKDMKASFLSNILDAYPSLSPKWLVTGNGDMLLAENNILQASEPLAEYNKRIGTPYYNQIVSAGNQLSLYQSDIKGYINIPEVKCMAYFDVRGYSMKGVVENGDIIGVDEIEFRRVDPSRPHLIITTDQYMVKYIHYNDETPEYVTCTSTNHDDFKVYIEDIVAVYLIKVITRFL